MPARFAAALIAVALWATPAAAQQAPLLHAIFQDHAVLQRDRPIPVWGRAKPGEAVRVTLAGQSVSARADDDGSWSAQLGPLPAGGPFELVATAGGVAQAARDVLIGDVWLCSGQSNMEYPLNRVLNAAAELRGAADPALRLLTIEHHAVPAPAREFGSPVQWQPATPQSAAEFSAACYFMARDLRASEKVPMGLIDASWGGTAIDLWRSEAAIGGDPAGRDTLALLHLERARPAEAMARWDTIWGGWWRGASGDARGREPWQAEAPGTWKPVPSITSWEGWGVPELAAYDGILWYRTEIDLTAAQAAQGATLTLGVIEDADVTWVNGRLVGTTSSWATPRAYALPPKLLRAGRNRIVLAAIDARNSGGMIGPAAARAIRFADGTLLPLPAAEGWSYRATPGTGEPPLAPWAPDVDPAGIYNGMIAPLGRYGLRGVAWYQGEADAGKPDGYAARLASMMADWRTQFGNPDLPFLVVQLANFGARVPVPAESGFARIRDEQRKAVEADRKAALAVAIDLGEPGDIHPANKQDVGRRLARAARARVYGGTASPSGPRVRAVVREGEAIRVDFADVDGALVAYSSGEALGFELCAEAMCRFVPGKLERNAVRLMPGARAATHVRYCWGGSPVCNLYDASGLPAGPFERRIEP